MIVVFDICFSVIVVFILESLIEGMEVVKSVVTESAVAVSTKVGVNATELVVVEVVFVSVI